MCLYFFDLEDGTEVFIPFDIFHNLVELKTMN